MIRREKLEQFVTTGMIKENASGENSEKNVGWTIKGAKSK